MAGKESLPRTTGSSAQRKSRLLLTTDSSDKHNQAPGQVRGPRRLGGRAGIEALGFAEKDCRKAAPKEEQDGRSCESNCQGSPQGETPQGGANQQQPEVGPQGESRLWDKSRKTAARQLRRRSGLGKPANQMSGNERVKWEDQKHGVDSLCECWICCGKDTRKRACEGI